MCTISIARHSGGIRVVCNRDERRDRSAALAPAEYPVGATGRALFPRDPDGGGTWIGVNRAGLVAAMLNRNSGPHEGQIGSGFRRTSSSRHPTSRGIIVPFLLQFERAADALAHLERLSATSFAPFRVVLVDGRFTWTAAGGGGLRLEVERYRLVRPHVFASSGLGDALVERPRRRLFQELVLNRRNGLLAAQAAFHRHHWPNAPAISVLMSRVDARTVSRTQVDRPLVGPIVMRYDPLADVSERSQVC
jgi:hypothetical protein